MGEYGGYDVQAGEQEDGDEEDGSGDRFFRHQPSHTQTTGQHHLIFPLICDTDSLMFCIPGLLGDACVQEAQEAHSTSGSQE